MVGACPVVLAIRASGLRAPRLSSQGAGCPPVVLGRQHAPQHGPHGLHASPPRLWPGPLAAPGRPLAGDHQPLNARSGPGAVPPGGDATPSGCRPKGRSCLVVRPPIPASLGSPGTSALAQSYPPRRARVPPARPRSARGLRAVGWATHPGPPNGRTRLDLHRVSGAVGPSAQLALGQGQGQRFNVPRQRDPRRGAPSKASQHAQMGAPGWTSTA